MQATTDQDQCAAWCAHPAAAVVAKVTKMDVEVMMIYILLAIILALVLAPVALHVANECRQLCRSWRLDNIQVWTATQTARLDVLERYDWHDRQVQLARFEIRRHRLALLEEVSSDE